MPHSRCPTAWKSPAGLRRDPPVTAHVDLNLLRVLDALLAEGSVAKAAVRLHLSAPAVSRSLGRLRRALGDPLFVRSGRGLVPTPRALELHPEVQRALDLATTVLAPAPEGFDPAGLRRVFSISAGDAIVAALGTKLIDAVRDQAPHASITFWPDTNETTMLRNNQVDLDLGAADGLGPEIESEVLFKDRFVLGMREGHPMLASPTSLKTFAAASHIAISSKGRRLGPVDVALQAHGLTRDRITVVASFVVAAHLAASSDAVVVIPSAVIRAFTPLLPLTSIDLPLATPELPVCQSWHQRNSKDPAHQWLRATVRSVVPAS